MRFSHHPSELTQTEFRLGCVAHWLPKPSETFILDEMRAIHRLHPALEIFTLYGHWRGPLSPELSAEGLCVHRMGVRAIARILRDQIHWFRSNGPAARRLWREVPWRKWSDLETAGENLWAFLCGFSLARQAQRRNIAHLHACWANGPATAAWVASRLTGIPFSFSTWAGDVFPPDGALAEKIHDAQFVRSTCQTFLPHLQRYAGSAPGKIQVIRNGQDPTRFWPAEPRFVSPIRLLALGRFVAKKGLEDALSATALLNRDGIACELVLAGSGPQERRLKRLARKLGIAEHIRFPGFVPRHLTRELFRNCDLFVMPSQIDPHGDRDGIPNVVLEALLHRIPVVATAVGGIPELIRDGETGRLVPPNDPTALAQAMRDLIRDPEQARAMAARGCERVRREYDLDANSRALWDRIRNAAFLADREHGAP